MPTITVPGQFSFSFLGLPNLDVSNFISFKEIQHTGFKLPEATLTIEVDDPNYRKVLDAGTIISTAIGRSRSELQTLSDFRIIGEHTAPVGRKWRTTFTLLGNNRPFAEIPQYRAVRGTSVEAIIQLATAAGMTVDSAVTDAADSMVWRTLGDSPRDYLREVWLHSRLTSGTLLVATTSHDRIRLRNLTTLASQTPQLQFTNEADPGAMLSVTANIAEASSRAVTEIIGGTGTTTPTYDPSTGQYTTLASTGGGSHLIAGNRIVASVPQRTAGVIQHNTHARYIQAALDNRQTLALLNNVNFPVYFRNHFEAVRPLDVAELRIVGQTVGLSDMMTGTYVVAKVMRLVESRGLLTGVTLTREASR